MRKSAADMEKTESLFEKKEDHSKKKCAAKVCCLILSYSSFYIVGFYSGYMYSDCDGSMF